MRDAIREMEITIIKKDLSNIKPLNYLEIIEARTPMVRCRSWMS